MITKLFNHDSYKAHSVASELVNFCIIHKIETLRLDKVALKKLNLEDFLYIGRKVLGYVIDPKMQCSLILSIFDASPRKKDLQILVYSFFMSHIGKDYPTSTIKFLKGEIDHIKGKIKINLVQEIINNLGRYQEKRKLLPKIKEFTPPSSQTHKVHLEDARQKRKSMDEIHENSLINLFTNIPIKHGGGSFGYSNGGYMPISKFGLHEHYVELPISEISHPVSASIERMGFRLAKRDDQ